MSNSLDRPGRLVGTLILDAALVAAVDAVFSSFVKKTVVQMINLADVESQSYTTCQLLIVDWNEPKLSKQIQEIEQQAQVSKTPILCLDSLLDRPYQSGLMIGVPKPLNARLLRHILSRWLESDQFQLEGEG